MSTARPASVLTSQHVAMAFGTPVSTYLWPNSDELNATLRRVVLTREQASPGTSRSNAGGWHSNSDLLQWREEVIDTLQRRITTFALDLIRLTAGDQAPHAIALRIDAWANVSRRGNYHHVHDHPGAMWSGVYYVDGGHPDPAEPFAGKLELLDPRVGVSMLFTQKSALFGRFLIDPLPGLIVMFPSWLKHMVHPYAGEGERISIAFNIFVQSPAPTTGPGTPVA